jgi:hypothetical protein
MVYLQVDRLADACVVGVSSYGALCRYDCTPYTKQDGYECRWDETHRGIACRYTCIPEDAAVEATTFPLTRGTQWNADTCDAAAITNYLEMQSWPQK